jgi:hypothetical protein
LLLKKINLYLNANLWNEEVLAEVKRVRPRLIADSLVRAHFFWNAAWLSYLNSDDAGAVYHLRKYSEISSDTSLEFYLASVLIHKNTDTTLFQKHLQLLVKHDTLFRSLNCFMEVYSYNRKHLNWYLLSSALVPGLGTSLNGYPLKGFVSLALSASSVYGVVKLVEYGLYINAVLWGTGVGMKFYTGNIRLTEASFYKAESSKKQKLASSCELLLETVLKKYPLNLKR